MDFVNRLLLLDLPYVEQFTWISACSWIFNRQF